MNWVRATPRLVTQLAERHAWLFIVGVDRVLDPAVTTGPAVARPLPRRSAPGARRQPDAKRRTTRHPVVALVSGRVADPLRQRDVRPVARPDRRRSRRPTPELEHGQGGNPATRLRCARSPRASVAGRMPRAVLAPPCPPGPCRCRCSRPPFDRPPTRSWFLALYLPDAYQWPLIAAMIALGLSMLGAGVSLAGVRLIPERG